MAVDSGDSYPYSKWVDLDLRDAEGPLWGLAVAFYGVGDLVSTVIGLWLGAVEGNPLPAVLVDAASGLGGVVFVLTVWKALVLIGFVLLARRLGDPHRIAVPGTLAVLGLLIVAWNSAVLVAVGETTGALAGYP